MNLKLVGSMYGKSSIEIAHSVFIRYQTWPPQAILISDWSISKKSSPLVKPLGQINRNLVRSTYGRSSIKIAHRPDPLTNMAATGNSCNRNYSDILAANNRVCHNVRHENITLWSSSCNRNYSAILATLQITSYALGV